MRRPRLAEYGLAVILLATAFCPRAAHPQVVKTLSIDGRIATYLEQLAETSHVEVGRCLTGVIQDSVAVLAGVAETPWLLVSATDTTVAWRWWECPLGTLALWHAHPWRTVQRNPRFRWADCNLSSNDRAILRSPDGPPITLVSVKRGTTCVFLLLGDDAIRQIPFHR